MPHTLGAGMPRDHAHYRIHRNSSRPCRLVVYTEEQANAETQAGARRQLRRRFPCFTRQMARESFIVAECISAHVTGFSDTTDTLPRV